MKVTKIYCDHCEKELDDMYDYDNMDLKLNHIRINVDLCEDCFKKLCFIIGEFCNKKIED